MASGYFGGTKSVSITESEAFCNFTGPEAQELRFCGTLAGRERNDSHREDLEDDYWEEVEMNEKKSCPWEDYDWELDEIVDKDHWPWGN